MESNDQTEKSQTEGERRPRPRRRGGRGRAQGQSNRPQGQSNSPQGQSNSPQGQSDSPQGQGNSPQGQSDSPHDPSTRPQGQGNRSRGRGNRPQGQRSRDQGQSHRAAKVAIIAPVAPDASAWADKIQAHLQKHTRTVTRLNVEGDAGLTERLKEARAHGAHRIVAVGDEQFVRWAAQAMVGSLMPLAPVLIPGSKSIFGYSPISVTGWEKAVEGLLSTRFLKVDMAMGTVNPFVHQLLAGFPATNGTARLSTWQALFEKSQLKLKVQIDRASVEGEFWCLAVANADLPEAQVRWLPGSDWADQRLDLLLVRPRSTWERWKFLRALKRGEHGALPGVMRYRGHRITVHAEAPWRYSADGSQSREAASPLVVEARPQMLRLVVPEGG